MPLIFTGQYYDNSQPFSEYVNKSYLESSITKHLIDLNYRVELFPKFVDLNYLKSKKIAHNIMRKSGILDIDQGRQQSSNLIDLSLFKISPHIIRKYIYYNHLFSFVDFNRPMLFTTYNTKKKYSWSHIDYRSKDILFVNIIESESKVIYKNPAFKFFHLRGAHVPWLYDENGNIVEKDKRNGSRKNYKDHVLYTLKLTNDVLKKLYEIGIYDKSLIYILSDHGAGRSYETKLNPASRFDHFNSNSNSIIPYKVKARAIPLFMKKMPFSKGELKISNSQISNAEFSQILLQDLKPSASNSNYDESKNKLRRYFYYEQNNKLRNYLPPMFEFYINGDSWLDSSWHGPNKVYSREGIYNKLFSIEFNKNQRCFDSADEKIQNDSFDFFKRNENDYVLKTKINIQNQLLLTVSFNYLKPEKNNLSLDISFNNNKIPTIKAVNYNNIFNLPYPIRIIDEKNINLNDKNNFILKIIGSPKQCIYESISSLHLFELEKQIL